MEAIIALPPMTLKWMAISGMQGLVTASAYASERKEPAPYSKFAHDSAVAKAMGAQVPSRLAMLVIYTPALVAAAGQILLAARGVLDTPSVVSMMLCGHFMKRDLEVLFLHKYSGTIPLANSCMIGTFYMLSTMLVNVAVRTEQALTGPQGHVSAGVGLFVVGQLGNLYHHWLLARLRKGRGSSDGGSSSSGYSVPRGGFFEYVTMPHYFFELVAWYGIALAARQLNVLLVATGMTSYLFGRAASTTEWYRKKVPGYPAERKHILPFLF